MKGSANGMDQKSAHFSREQSPENSNDAASMPSLPYIILGNRLVCTEASPDFKCSLEKSKAKGSAEDSCLVRNS